MCSVCHNKSCLSLTEKLHQKYTILNKGSTSGLKSTLGSLKGIEGSSRSQSIKATSLLSKDPTSSRHLNSQFY